MSARRLLLIIAVGIVVVLGARHARDPRRTPLPFGSTDLSSVQEQLARLPDAERVLVEAYVKRSNGDVLSAQFADPDDPLTARTFGEAIELQRNWIAKMEIDDARLAELRAERDARIEPLRAIVAARVVKAEILTAEQLRERENPGAAQAAPTAAGSPSFVIRIRLHNLGSETVVGLTGSLQAHDRDEYLPLDLCWIDLGSPQALAPGASIEFDCGRSRGGASAQQRAYVDPPPGRFTDTWEPRHIKLASGRELDSGL